MSTELGSLDYLQGLCENICHILEREHSVLRSRNGLIGSGVEELEELHIEKEREIEVLDRLSREDTYLEEVRTAPLRASEVRSSIERCKILQARNHQVFSRVVTAQRRIISVLREPDEAVSLYDRGGRSTDHGLSRRAERA